MPATHAYEGIEDYQPVPRTLSAAHITQLTTESALTDEVIKARHYYTEYQKAGLQRLGFSVSQRLTPSLVLPLYDFFGERIGYQIRPDSPRMGKHGKLLRYENPIDTRMVLDFPPLQHNRDQLRDATTDLYVTEGIKKADSLASQGLCSMTLLGVWNWRGRDGAGSSSVLPEWDCLPLENRIVWICFDSDVMQQPAVYKALQRLSAFLDYKKAIPKYIYLPLGIDGKKCGIDDFFSSGHTVADLDQYRSDELRACPEAENKVWTHDDLILNNKGEPTENTSNIALILSTHPYWEHCFWFDEIRNVPMYNDNELNDNTVTMIATWLGVEMRMPVKSLRLVERCVLAICQDTKRDLLQEWLYSLPEWDKQPRLEFWLGDYAGATQDVLGIDAYANDVSRIIPVAMVARALNPGCQYRNVVILEGVENAGKSKLIRALASPDFYGELNHDLANKESFMAMRGKWVIEFAELDSFSRTEENRLKGFITSIVDEWVPKYSNFATQSKRRCIFIGSTNNEESYLKGQSGNTRFLPIRVGTINVEDFEMIREQLFAEALVYYKANPLDWWQLSSDGEVEACLQREERRVQSNYEEDLGPWLDERRFNGDYSHENKPVRFEDNVTTWTEIARYYLQLPPAQWSNPNIAREITKALKALGWVQSSERLVQGDRKKTRVWRKHRTQ